MSLFIPLKDYTEIIKKFSKILELQGKSNPYGEYQRDTSLGDISKEFAEELVRQRVLDENYRLRREQNGKKSMFSTETKIFLKSYEHAKTKLIAKHNTTFISQNDIIAAVLQGTYHLLEPHYSILDIKDYVKKFEHLLTHK